MEKKYIGVFEYDEKAKAYTFNKYEAEEDILHQLYKLLHCELVQCLDLSDYLPDYEYLRDVLLVIDEEGKLKSNTHPFMPLCYRGQPYDVVVGSVALIGIAGDGFSGLTEWQLEERYTLMQLYRLTCMSVDC